METLKKVRVGKELRKKQIEIILVISTMLGLFSLAVAQL